MNTYRWTGAINNQRQEGELSAKNIHYARAILHQQHIKIKTLKKRCCFFQKKLKYSRQSQLYFLKQLATFLKSGLNLLEAISIIKNSQNGIVKEYAKQTEVKLKKGEQLHEALETIVDKMSCQLIAIGETSGKLETMLEYAAEIKYTHHKLINQVKSALFYPSIVCLLALAISILLLKFVIPQFAILFAEQHTALPLPTRVVLSLSSHLHYALLPILALLISFITLLSLNKKLAGMAKNTALSLLSKSPFSRTIIRSACFAHLATALNINIEAGIPIIKALEGSIALLPLNSLKQQLRKSLTHLKAGETFASSLSHAPLLPPLFIELLEHGERSGQLTNMLGQLKTHYQDQLETYLSRCRILLEPMIMLILGAMIGGLMLAMYLPMFQMGKAL
jgi:type IV pilus assembly protein PilC